MQNSYVYINESGPERVEVDFRSAAQQLVSRQHPYGFALQKTTEQLGLEPDVDSNRLYLAGTTESVKDRLPDLQRHIGLIARASANLDSYTSIFSRAHLGRILGALTGRDLPDLSINTSLMRTVGVIVGPFAEAVSSDGTYVHYARMPDRTGKNSAARHADGSPMGRFDDRDIGGLLIGWDGLPARESYNVTIPIEQELA